MLVIHHLCFVLQFDRRYSFEAFPFCGEVSRVLVTISGVLGVQAISSSGNFRETSPAPSPWGHIPVFLWKTGVLAK